MKLRTMACAACVAALGGQAAAGAQPAAPGTSHYDLSLPMFAAGAGSPYDLSGASLAPSGAPLTAPAPASLPENYTFNAFRQNVHGYVSAGVATHDGHNFAGGVEMPLVPGKVDLAFGGNTGQIGGWARSVPGGKPGTLKYDSYYASVHLHPADDLDAYITVARGHLSLPATPWGP